MIGWPLWRDGCDAGLVSEQGDVHVQREANAVALLRREQGMEKT